MILTEGLALNPTVLGGGGGGLAWVWRSAVVELRFALVLGCLIRECFGWDLYWGKNVKIKRKGASERVRGMEVLLLEKLAVETGDNSLR